MSQPSIIPGQAGDNAPQSVLFVCTMNAIRSPMASAIARTLFPKQIYFRSAGILVGENDPFVHSVMTEANVDISTHVPRSYEELEDDHFDLTIALTPDARDWLAGVLSTDASEIEFWPLPDPTISGETRAQKLDAYRSVRDTLVTRIKERFSWHK